MIMAKRKSKKFKQQPINPDLQARFKAIMKPERKQSYLERKYSKLSVNRAYATEEDLKL